MKEDILKSIATIPAFAKDYPKLIITGNPKWDAFFKDTFDACVFRASQLEELRLSTPKLLMEN